jgi:glycosyltransferase involved in cell wall biosynthesis
MSILMPTYNGGAVLADTLRNVLAQDFSGYELIINDDRSTDNTREVVQSFNDPRIAFSQNERNLGYPRNLEACRRRATGKILFLMAQDDLLARNAIRRTLNAFELADDIGAVTRPFFWFDTDPHIPVRTTVELNRERDEIVSVGDDFHRIMTTFLTLGQLSGLAFRTDYIDTPFHEDVFSSHIYPFASILKKHPVVFLKDFTVAVRIRTSQSRHVSSIYDKSPMKSWIDMYQEVFSEERFRQLRDRLVKDEVAINHVGLVQIRNYSTYRNLLREIGNLVKYRRRNLISPSFWFFSIGCMLMPPSLLIPIVDWYKNHIHARSLPDIKFEYDI